jgi:hypothetical protein
MSRRLLQYDEEIGYRFIPQLRARVPHESGGYLVRTNAAGFRCDHEFAAARPAHRRRVLLFGDSFTAGEGVSNGKRYGDVLERLVTDLDVFNFGLPGTGPDQQLLAYRAAGAGLEHDLLVIAVLVENIRRVVARYRYYTDETGQRLCYAKPYFEQTPAGLVARHVPPPRAPVAEAELPADERAHIDRVGRFPRLRKLLTRTGTERLAHRITGWQAFPQYDDAADPAWQLLAAILRTWMAEHGGRTLVVPLPTYYHVEELCMASGYQARFRELARDTGCALHDPLADLQAYSAEERRGFRFTVDPHLTPAGHTAVARSLAPAIAALLDGVVTNTAHG